MKNIVRLLIGILFISANIYGQEYMTRSGYIWFYSQTPVEDIKAHNRQVACILNTETGEVGVTLLMKSFEFKKALMQRDFNRQYVESDKYPKATLEGKITDFSKVDFSEAGEYKVPVSGKLTIHGVTNEINTDVTMTVKEGDVVTAKTMFIVSPADYDINIPKVVREKIAKEIEVHVDFELKKR
jgi:hypothetical protein